MAKKNKPKNLATPGKIVHKELKDMDIRVNEFGQIVKDYNIDEINSFLQEKVADKKLPED